MLARVRGGADRSAANANGRVRVLHLGPEAVGDGGMAGSIRRLLASPLAERYDMEALATWRPDAGLAERAAMFVRSLHGCVRWALKGPGVVHVHMAVRGSWYRKSLCVLLGRALGRPVVLQLRCGGGDIRAFDARIGPLRRAAFRFAFGKATRVVSVSGEGARLLEDRFGCSEVAVVTNPAPEVEAPAGLPPAPGGPPQLLYVGGFKDPAKGPDVLVEALGEVLASHPEVRVTLAGPGDPTPAARALIAANPGVEWCGWLDSERKTRALATVDLFVLPSVSEGMPNAMLEAMAHGRAVVASRVGGVPDVVTDGVDGIVVEPGDPGGLAAAIARVLEDHELRDRIGRAARDRAQRLSRDEVWGRLDGLYGSLSGR